MSAINCDASSDRRNLDSLAPNPDFENLDLEKKISLVLSFEALGKATKKKDALGHGGFGGVKIDRDSEQTSRDPKPACRLSPFLRNPAPIGVQRQLEYKRRRAVLKAPNFRIFLIPSTMDSKERTQCTVARKQDPQRHTLRARQGPPRSAHVYNVTKVIKISSDVQEGFTWFSVLLRCLYRAQCPDSPTPDTPDSKTPLSECSQRSLERPKLGESTSNNSSRASRRSRTRIPSPQRVIQKRINEIKQSLQIFHLNAWLLRQDAARRCFSKAYFLQRHQQFVRYRNRDVLEWEIELETLLRALREPPWDKSGWRNNLSLVLDS
ncbi:hypothetical protein DFH07DRAFT_991324 [Mycena maculata]|uniref:Uncharacterized protein n=1 Tax=Mycena maculata TaxID=230809 RepID=A0AAD7JVW7_9AGAR|nr:hypothetical protein DFH07DRAFT_991324 [Mycena maculata]